MAPLKNSNTAILDASEGIADADRATQPVKRPSPFRKKNLKSEKIGSDVALFPASGEVVEDLEPGLDCDFEDLDPAKEEPDVLVPADEEPEPGLDCDFEDDEDPEPDEPPVVVMDMDDVVEPENVPVINHGEVLLPSTLDPSKRTPNYKLPYPDDQWKPWWKPRKRPPGQKGWKGQAEHMKLLAESLAERVDNLENLPRDARGVPVYSPEVLKVMEDFVSAGGTLFALAKALGISRTTIYKWVKKYPEMKAAYERSKVQGVEALAEKALSVATTPAVMEDVYESYDGEGKLVRRDVKRADAIYARKLALHGITSLIAKWAPERYGEKPQAKTTESLAQRILAARRRVEQASKE